MRYDFKWMIKAIAAGWFVIVLETLLSVFTIIGSFWGSTVLLYFALICAIVVRYRKSDQWTPGQRVAIMVNVVLLTLAGVGLILYCVFE